MVEMGHTLARGGVGTSSFDVDRHGYRIASSGRRTATGVEK
jgi:hypothetical protein